MALAHHHAPRIHALIALIAPTDVDGHSEYLLEQVCSMCLFVLSEAPRKAEGTRLVPACLAFPACILAAALSAGVFTDSLLAL